MLTYLDTCIFIYWIEGPAPFDARVRTHLATLQAAGNRFAISEFSRPECLVKPLGVGDGALLVDYERMFLAPNVAFVPLNTPVYERAANIRGVHAYASGKQGRNNASSPSAATSRQHPGDRRGPEQQLIAIIR